MTPRGPLNMKIGRDGEQNCLEGGEKGKEREIQQTLLFVSECYSEKGSMSAVQPGVTSLRVKATTSRARKEKKKKGRHFNLSDDLQKLDSVGKRGTRSVSIRVKGGLVVIQGKRHTCSAYAH